jgi:uncharacterized peroxidase-related enzyme
MACASANATIVTEARISRFPVAEIADLPDDLRERVLEIQERTGFVPNVFLALGHRPAELRGFLDLHDALMESDEGLSRVEREMIVVATSAANDCLYCVIAHGAILRIRARDPLIADQLATNPLRADLDERGRTLVEFALKVAEASAAIDDGDIDELRSAGFSEDEIWDIAAISSLFAYSNRMANFTAMLPNPEFYSMGR